MVRTKDPKQERKLKLFYGLNTLISENFTSSTCGNGFEEKTNTTHINYAVQLVITRKKKQLPKTVIFL